jgi:Mce-associated membrane protein
LSDSETPSEELVELTETEAAEDSVETEETEETEESVEIEASEELTESDDDVPPEPNREPSAARKWLANNTRRVQLASAVALFVAAGAFAGAALQPYLMDRATIATKEKIARTAAGAITTLWSYTPDDMDTLSDRSARYLGGDFAQEYRRYVDAIAPTNKQAKVTSATKVVGVAVESVRDSDATAIVYTNTTSTSPQSNNVPSLKYLSYRLELMREGRDWRVTKMTTVTSLDLTPKL